jgi:AraC-like DNA-binding protein
MHIRNELNQQLYQMKMDGVSLPHLREEYARYACILSGDTESTSKWILQHPLPTDILSFSDNPLQNARYHFVTEAATLVRLTMESGLSHDEARTLSALYIRKLDRTNSPLEVNHLYGQLCADFAQRMCEIRREGTKSVPVRKCITYIYENLGSDLSLPSLGKVTGLNPSYLSRLFHQETGSTLGQFILAAKVDTAKNLLAHSDLSCARIGSSLGFSSQIAFIAVFRKVTGVTPGVWRNRCWIKTRE